MFIELSQNVWDYVGNYFYLTEYIMWEKNSWEAMKQSPMIKTVEAQQRVLGNYSKEHFHYCCQFECRPQNVRLHIGWPCRMLYTKTSNEENIARLFAWDLNSFDGAFCSLRVTGISCYFKMLSREFNLNVSVNMPLYRLICELFVRWTEKRCSWKSVFRNVKL